MVLTHDGILLSFKKMNPICSNMNGPRYYHTKWSKSDGQRADNIWYHLYVESKKTDLQTQKTSSSSPKETGGGRCDKLGGWD